MKKRKSFKEFLNEHLTIHQARKLFVAIVIVTFVVTEGVNIFLGVTYHRFESIFDQIWMGFVFLILSFILGCCFHISFFGDKEADADAEESENNAKKHVEQVLSKDEYRKVMIRSLHPNLNLSRLASNELYYGEVQDIVEAYGIRFYDFYAKINEEDDVVEIKITEKDHMDKVKGIEEIRYAAFQGDFYLADKAEDSKADDESIG